LCLFVGANPVFAHHQRLRREILRVAQDDKRRERRALTAAHPAKPITQHTS